MTRVHLDAVVELEQALERAVETLGAVPRIYGQVWSGRVADEERVAGEHEPRIRPARAIDHGQAAVLRPVPGRVDAAQDDVAELDLVSVLERVVRVLGFRGGMDRDRQAVLEREAAVSGEMIRMSVRLDDADDPHAAALGLLEVLLDRVGGIDHDRLAGALVAHEIRRATKGVVDELGEDHGAADRSTGSRYLS